MTQHWPDAPWPNETLPADPSTQDEVSGPQNGAESLPACRNCDGRKCMGCVLREYDHYCADDCPDCCAPTAYYDPLTSSTLLGWRIDCDCPMNPFHRWNCSRTPIWAQTIRDLDLNPSTFICSRDLALDPDNIHDLNYGGDD